MVGTVSGGQGKKLMEATEGNGAIWSSPWLVTTKTMGKKMQKKKDVDMSSGRLRKTQGLKDGLKDGYRWLSQVFLRWLASNPRCQWSSVHLNSFILGYQMRLSKMGSPHWPPPVGLTIATFHDIFPAYPHYIPIISPVLGQYDLALQTSLYPIVARLHMYISTFDACTPDYENASPRSKCQPTSWKHPDVCRSSPRNTPLFAKHHGCYFCLDHISDLLCLKILAFQNAPLSVTNKAPPPGLNLWSVEKERQCATSGTNCDLGRFPFEFSTKEGAQNCWSQSTRESPVLKRKNVDCEWIIFYWIPFVCFLGAFFYFLKNPWNIRR